MKYFLSFFSLFFCFDANAQKTIYFDNRDNSVVEFFKNRNIVDFVAAENGAMGMVIMQFVVAEKGYVSEIKKIFAADELLFVGLEKALVNSSGKWKIRKGLRKQRFQICLFVSNPLVDSSMNLKNRNVAFLDVYTRMTVQESGISEELVQLPFISVFYPFVKYKRDVVQSRGVSFQME